MTKSYAKKRKKTESPRAFIKTTEHFELECSQHQNVDVKARTPEASTLKNTACLAAFSHGDIIGEGKLDSFCTHLYS